MYFPFVLVSREMGKVYIRDCRLSCGTHEWKSPVLVRVGSSVSAGAMCFAGLGLTLDVVVNFQRPLLSLK
jgi:hypothetical protein